MMGANHHLKGTKEVPSSLAHGDHQITGLARPQSCLLEMHGVKERFQTVCNILCLYSLSFFLCLTVKWGALNAIFKT